MDTRKKDAIRCVDYYSRVAYAVISFSYCSIFSTSIDLIIVAMWRLLFDRVIIASFIIDVT